MENVLERPSWILAYKRQDVTHSLLGGCSKSFGKEGFFLFLLLFNFNVRKLDDLKILTRVLVLIMKFTGEKPVPQFWLSLSKVLLKF